jgi:hypothetical protein
MPAVTYYLGRPASFWIEVMSRRPARAAAANQAPDASPDTLNFDLPAARHFDLPAARPRVSLGLLPHRGDVLR